MRWWFKLSVSVVWSIAGLLFCPSHGRAKCASPENCLCDFMEEGPYLVRATVTSVNASTILMKAEEVFRTDPNMFVDINPGEIFGGEIDAVPPCGGMPVTFTAGDEVLAFYVGGTQTSYSECRDYVTCTHTECVPDSADWDLCDGECVIKTQQACAEHRNEVLASGLVTAVPFADEITLRETADGSLSIASEDIADLYTYEGCREHFPDPPTSPCNDHVGPCSTATPSSTDGWRVLEWAFRIFAPMSLR